MSTIAKLIAREVLDSRGRPTVEVEARAHCGALARALVPSGASTGRHEARELRDGDPLRFEGRGVLAACRNVETEINDALVGADPIDQAGIDEKLIRLDGAPDKSRLGANAVLGASLACARLAAKLQRIELFLHINRLWNDRAEEPLRCEPTLPLPMVNMISGGRHAGGNLDFQDFLAIPVAADRFREALRVVCSVYVALGRTLEARGDEGTLVGDEGGFGPKLGSNELALARLLEAISAAGFAPGRDIALALDVAASEFHDEATQQYTLKYNVNNRLNSREMCALLESWTAHAPIASIEDGLAEDDWEGWSELTARLGSKIQLIGDDLFTTSVDRLQRGVSQGAANAILVKPNQAGTLTETLDVMLLAREFGYATIVSARSGETEDDTIADLAVGAAAGQIKIGGPARSERLAKYNRLARIEDRYGLPFAKVTFGTRASPGSSASGP